MKLIWVCLFLCAVADQAVVVEEENIDYGILGIYTDYDFDEQPTQISNSQEGVEYYTLVYEDDEYLVSVDTSKFTSFLKV